MTHIILYLTTALELVLVAWGKQQYSPVLPSPSTFTSDPITIRFTQSVFSVSEINGPAEPVLALSRSSNYTISVKVRVTDGTAKGGLDYVKFDNDLAEVIFPAGSIYAVLEVKIIDDKLFEGHSSEVFNLAIVNASLPYGVEFDSFGSTNAVVTILDDDFPYITFGNSDYTVGENDTLHVNITLSHASVFDMTVTVYATTVNATESDFAFGSYEVDIPANSKEGLLSISITNDTVFEFNKTFLLIIEDGSLPQLVRAGTPRIATVTIVEDCVNFGQANYTVYEDDNLLEILVEVESGKKASTDIFMQVVDMRSTAENGTDYESGPFNVTIKQGECNATFYVEIIDDSLYENDEDFSLVIIADSLKPDNVCLGHTIKAKVSIVDDEYVLAFGKRIYVFEEDKAKLSLLVSKPLRENIIVTFTYLDLTATGNHSTNDKKEIDYYASSAVTFPANSTKIDFTLNIVDDSRLESNEIFRIIANPPEVPSGQLSPSAEILIIDDDDFRITFEMDHYVIDKNKVDPTVKLLLRHPEGYIGSSIFPINVTVDKVNATIGKNADAENVDFVFQSYRLSFQENETEKVLIIHSIDNSIVESNETCILIINQDSITSGFDRIPSGRIIAGEYSRAMITIVNDDDCVSFDQANYTVYEDDGLLEIVVKIESGKKISNDIFMQVEDMRSTAENGTDYKSGPFNVTIKQGECNATFYVEIINDSVYENDEDFSLAIIADSLKPDNICLGHTIKAKVTIADDEYTLSFEESSYVLEEDIYEVKLSLSVSRPLREDITVTFTYLDFTTFGNQSTNDKKEIDYYASNAVTFPAHSTKIDFILNIVDDSRLEINELFRVIAIPPEVPSGQTPPSADFIIRDDDDFRITFEMDHYVIDKNKGDPVVKLLLRYPEGYIGSIMFPINVTVDKLNATTGDAENVDFVFQRYNLSFEENDTEKALIIHSVDNSIVGSNEACILIINQDSITTGFGRGIPNYRIIIGEYSRAMITIINDDAKESCSITMIQGSFKHNLIRRRTTFRFSSDGDPKAKYKCKLDKRKFDECKSPMVWKNLRRGKHTVTVRAVWTVDEGKTLASVKRKFKFIVL